MAEQLKIAQRDRTFEEIKRPGLLFRYGAPILFLFLLVCFVYSRHSNPLEKEQAYELVFEDAWTEEDLLAERQGKIYKIYVETQEVVQQGDTLFALADASTTNNLKLLNEILLGEKLELKTLNKVNELGLADSISIELKAIKNMLWRSGRSILSKNTKELIKSDQQEILRSEKEQEQLIKSIPIFEKLLEEARANLEVAREKYRDGSINLNELEKSINAVTENEDFIRIRERSLRDEEAYERNLRQKIARTQAKAKPIQIDQVKLNKLKVDLREKVKSTLERMFVLSPSTGEILKLKPNGDFNSGDLLALIKITKSDQEAKPRLYALIPDSLSKEIEVGEDILVLKETDKQKSTHASRILEKNMVKDQNYFKAYLAFEDEMIDPNNEFIYSAQMTRDTGQKSFFESFWSNFGFKL